MDYYKAYKKYKRKYKTLLFGGGHQPLRIGNFIPIPDNHNDIVTSPPVVTTLSSQTRSQYGGAQTVASFTLRGESQPCLVVLDLPDVDLASAHQMFQQLQHADATPDGCEPALPNPELVSRRYGCFGPRRVRSEKGRTMIKSCRFNPEQRLVASQILDTSIQLLQTYLEARLEKTGVDNNIKVNGKEPLIESHRYTSHERCQIPSRPFAWHQDDFGGVDFNTYTILYYLHKSETFLGGNFSCAFRPGEVELVTSDGAGITLSDDTITEGGEQFQVYHITTQSRRVVLMRGDLWHIPAPFQDACHGCRDSVVVQVARK